SDATPSAAKALTRYSHRNRNERRWPSSTFQKKTHAGTLMTYVVRLTTQSLVSSGTPNAGSSRLEKNSRTPYSRVNPPNEARTGSAIRCRNKERTSAASPTAASRLPTRREARPALDMRGEIVCRGRSQCPSEAANYALRSRAADERRAAAAIESAQSRWRPIARFSIQPDRHRRFRAGPRRFEAARHHGHNGCRTLGRFREAPDLPQAGALRPAELPAPLRRARPRGGGGRESGRFPRRGDPRPGDLPRALAPAIAAQLARPPAGGESGRKPARRGIHPHSLGDRSPFSGQANARRTESSGPRCPRHGGACDEADRPRRGRLPARAVRPRGGAPLPAPLRAARAARDPADVRARGLSESQDRRRLSRPWRDPRAAPRAD